MRTILLATLLAAAGLISPCAHTQTSERDRKTFEDTKAKAEKGDAEAQCNLGVFYHDGRGVAKNYPEAVKWYRQAAEQNFAEAQQNLGMCYAAGTGVAKDYVETYKWWRLAAAQGLENSKIDMPRLESLMSPEQIAAGKQHASDWLEQRKTSSSRTR